MTLDERFAGHARDWGVTIDEIRSTETSQLGFGTRGNQLVVLKVIRKEDSEEWRCGEVLEAFRGQGMIRPIEYTGGAVLLPRVRPGHVLASLSVEGLDEQATDIIASLIQRMANRAGDTRGVGSVERLQPDFASFRDRGDDLIPRDFVDRAEILFTELCMTQRDVRLLHGDLHHYNVLFDTETGWIVIDPWGAIGEIEFEIGAALRNPVEAPALLGDPGVIERRLRTVRGSADLQCGSGVEVGVRNHGAEHPVACRARYRTRPASTLCPRCTFDVGAHRIAACARIHQSQTTTLTFTT